MEKFRANDLSEDLANWMTKLPPKLKALPINLLAIPGSHDSMTSDISRKSKLAPDAEDVLMRLKFLGPLLRLIMARWARTQAHDVTDQLNLGVRYLDLRVATKKNSAFPYFVHGQYSTDVPDMFAKLKEFLSTHPEEVVILDFQHFYAFAKTDHDNLIRLIKSTFGSLILPYARDMDHVTLEYMTLKCRYQLIIVYRTYFVQFDEPLLWHDTSFPTPWPQTIEKTELFEKLNAGVATRDYNVGYVSQCVLTPTKGFVGKHVFSTLKKQCAKPIQKDIIEWVKKHKVGIGGVNIIICDFIDLKDGAFPREVIGLNAKFLHNSLLSASNLTPIDN